MYIRRQPIKILLNVTVIVACVILIGISVPSVTPLLTDPYTAWKNRGDGGGASGAKLVASDTEAVTYIAPENVVSGYSRDDSTLGEGFDFLYSPVMTIQSPIRSYWRGETRRIYTGTGWANLDQEERGYMLYSGESTGEMVQEEFPKIKTQRVEQTIKMETDKPYPVMFGAYTMRNVEVINEEDDDTPAPKLRWAGREAELHFGDSESALLDSSEANIYPKRYKVVSDVPLIPLDEIKKASVEELYSDSQNDSDYLQIPSTLPQRVKDLAEEITASGATPYEKMELLQSYLRQNFEYTNKPDLSRKQSGDFVDGFLFEIKQGYCDYYSTAMVMMARSLGVPARWVKGYAPGTLPSSDFMQQRMISSESGSYRVNNADAHSWAELYFGDYGWITFEATPGFDAPMLYWDENEGAVATSKDQLLDDTGGGSFEGFGGINSSVLRTITIVSIVIVALAAVYWLRASIYFGIKRLQKGRSLSPGEKAVFETLRVVNRLKRRGLERNDSETLRESFNRWRVEKPELSSMLGALLAQFELASYSQHSFTNEQWRDVRTLSRQLFKATRKRVRKI
ncbi:Protein-glutamine gamma-glutamyltransferase [compost metagenome]